MACYKLMKSAMRNRKECTILYATETGQSERCAYKLQRQFEQEFNVEVCCITLQGVVMMFTPVHISLHKTYGNLVIYANDNLYAKYYFMPTI